YSGGGDEDILAGDQVVRRQHTIEVVAVVDELLPLLVVAWPEPALDAATDCLQRCGGNDPLGSAADAIEQVHPRPTLRRCDRRRDVAVADQVDLRPGLPQLADQRLVTVALEHDDGDLPCRDA